jgi:aconitase B
VIPLKLPYKEGTRSVEVVTARHADAVIESCLSTVQGRDTVGGSGDSPKNHLIHLY